MGSHPFPFHTGTCRRACALQNFHALICYFYRQPFFFIITLAPTDKRVQQTVSELSSKFGSGRVKVRISIKAGHFSCEEGRHHTKRKISTKAEYFFVKEDSTEIEGSKPAANLYVQHKRRRKGVFSVETKSRMSSVEADVGKYDLQHKEHNTYTLLCV